MRKSITLLLLVMCLGFGGAVKGQLQITEIMYLSPIGGANDGLEYIELYNNSNAPIDMGGYTFTSGVVYTFPPSTILNPGQFAIVMRNGTTFQTSFGIPCQLFNWSAGSLNNTGEEIVLKTAATGGVTVDSVFYGVTAPWPTGGQGDGHSITYCNRVRDNQDGDTWIAASEQWPGAIVMGTQIFADPGSCCTYTDVTAPTILGTGMKNLNRIGIQFSEPVSISSVWAGNFSGNFTIGSVAYGATPDSIVVNLSTPLQEGITEMVHISGVTDTACNMITSDSFAVINNYVTEPVIICEILYDDPSSGDDLEFIEIVNVSLAAIPLGGFRLVGDIAGPLPEVNLPSGGRIVLAKDPNLVASTFGIPDVYGWQSGQLDNSSALIQLVNDAGVNDSLTYSSVGPWPLGANGTGHSIMLCVEAVDNSDPSNWSLSNGVGDFTVVYQGDSLYATPWRENCRLVGILGGGISDLKIYPNPFSQSFEVRIEGMQEAMVVITDALGRSVAKTQVVDGQASVNLVGQPAGVYFVNIKSESGDVLAVRKVVRI